MELTCFTEEFNHTLDSQRRVAIPSAWRKQTQSDTWFLVPGKNGFLQLITSEQFAPFLDKVKKVSFTNSVQQKALALFASSLQMCRSDKQGRIQIAGRLLDHAGIKDDLILVGAIGNIEVWNPERWLAYKCSAGESYLDIVQSIGESADAPLEQLMSAFGGGAK